MAILNKVGSLLLGRGRARPGRNMLFVCGAPRSGTTGLWRLLVQDPRIVLGMERHGSRLRPQAFRTDLYQKSGFFDFETYPNLARLADSYYANEAKQRFDSAVYVGDKLPLLYKVYDFVSAVFPSAKTVILLRNIFDICESYQARLEDAADNWKFSAMDAVDHWNSLLVFLAHRRKDPRVKVLVYEQFLSDINPYRDLYDFLGLSVDEGFMGRYEKMLEEAARLKLRRTSRITDAQKLEILRAADLGLYAKHLRRFALARQE